MWSPGGVGIDVNGDGVSDLRVGHFGEVRPDVGMAYGGMAGPAMGYPGMGYPGMGTGVDLNGDGVSDVRVGAYGQVRPDVGMYAPQYGPGYYPPY